MKHRLIVLLTRPGDVIGRVQLEEIDGLQCEGDLLGRHDGKVCDTVSYAVRKRSLRESSKCNKKEEE